jgi:hypothetical protein
MFRKLSVGTEKPGTVPSAAPTESKMSRSSSGRNLAALAAEELHPQADRNGRDGTTSSLHRSPTNPSSLLQRSRASSVLSDVHITLGSAAGHSSVSHLRSVDVRSQDACMAAALQFRPQVVVGRDGRVQLEGKAALETRRPVVLLFDANERFLELTAKVICRRLHPDNCLVCSSQASAIATAFDGDGGVSVIDSIGGADSGGGGGGASASVHVLWKKDGILQRSKVPLRRGMASGAACVVIKYGGGSGDLSPRRSLDANSGDFLLAALARSGSIVPAVVCVHDSLRDLMQSAVKVRASACSGHVPRTQGWCTHAGYVPSVCEVCTTLGWAAGGSSHARFFDFFSC